MNRHAISKIIPIKQEQLGGYDVVALTFAEAYSELRRVCPEGDLHIHLHVDAPEDVQHRARVKRDQNIRLSRAERHQLAADNGFDTEEDYRGNR